MVDHLGHPLRRIASVFRRRCVTTLDGQPLKSGTIRFDAADGRTAAADATIADGKFSAQVPPGAHGVATRLMPTPGTRKR